MAPVELRGIAMSVLHSPAAEVQLDQNMTRASPITSAGSNLRKKLLTARCQKAPSEERASENISYALHFKRRRGECDGK
jgi:hypothetical protein